MSLHRTQLAGIIGLRTCRLDNRRGANLYAADCSGLDLTGLDLKGTLFGGALFLQVRVHAWLCFAFAVLLC